MKPWLGKVWLAGAATVAVVGGLAFYRFFWLDHEYLLAKWTRQARIPIAKIETQVFYESDLYDAMDTARQFGVPADQVLGQFLDAQKTLIAGRKLKLFPTDTQVREAEKELYVPKLPGGLDLPVGSPVPMIYRLPSNWKTLTSKAQAVKDLAQSRGQDLAGAEKALFVRVWAEPLSDYPEGR